MEPNKASNSWAAEGTADEEFLLDEQLSEFDVEDLLGHYAAELRATGQDDEAERMTGLASAAPDHFLMIVPHKVQADPSISTE